MGRLGSLGFWLGESQLSELLLCWCLGGAFGFRYNGGLYGGRGLVLWVIWVLI